VAAIAALLDSRAALLALRRTLPKTGPGVVTCRSPVALRRVIMRRLVDAIVLCPNTALLPELEDLRRELPGIPVVAYAPFRPDDGELLLACRRHTVATVVVEGVDDPIVGDLVMRSSVTAERRAALARAVATSSARVVRLRARYFDTPDRRLAAAGFALRLRLEDRHWVQTLKGRGDGLMQRLEHEVAVPGALRTPPALDLARHAGTPAGDALAKVLGEEGAAQLGVLFETDVTRTLRLVRHEGAQVEVALDIGHLRAGEAQAALSEIEFELKRGPAAGLIALAARWAERHGLWLDVRTKAERGDRLARGLERALLVVVRREERHARARALVDVHLNVRLAELEGLHRLRRLLRFSGRE